MSRCSYPEGPHSGSDVEVLVPQDFPAWIDESADVIEAFPIHHATSCALHVPFVRARLEREWTPRRVAYREGRA